MVFDPTTTAAGDPPAPITRTPIVPTDSAQVAHLVYRPFWLVWAPQHAPVEHVDEPAAVAAAEALALAFPGTTFVVLRAMRARLHTQAVHVDFSDQA